MPPSRPRSRPIVAAIIATVALPALADDLPCTTVRSGDLVLPSVDCLNDRLAAMASDARKSVPDGRIDGAAVVDAPDRAGETSPAGARLRFGQNFGRSPTPYRPAPAPAPTTGLAGLLANPRP